MVWLVYGQRAKVAQRSCLRPMQRNDRRRTSLVVAELLELTEFTFRECELLAAIVECPVNICILLPERFVGFAGFPEVTSQIGSFTKGIAQEESSLVSRVAPEQPGPIARRPVYAFKPFSASPLDIELP